MNSRDLEDRINSAEAALNTLKTELEALKQQQQELEQESLFGRWATHPEYGRGLIYTKRPDKDGDVFFMYDADPAKNDPEGQCVPLGDLTLDPVTLTTTEDFEDAPNYTIAEDIDDSRCVSLKFGGIWYKAGHKDAVLSEEMPPCRVIRWGNGQ